MKQFIINMLKFSTSETSGNTRSRKDSEIILPSEKSIQKLKYLNSFLPSDLVPPINIKTLKHLSSLCDLNKNTTST